MDRSPPRLHLEQEIPLNTGINWSNLLPQDQTLAAKNVSSRTSIQHRLSRLEFRKRSRTLRQTSLTNFGGQRTIKERPLHHRGSTELCHRCQHASPSTHLGKLAGKAPRDLLSIFPYPRRNPSTKATKLASSPELLEHRHLRYCTTASGGRMTWAALCHPSKTRRPGLDPKYWFGLIKIWPSVLDSTAMIKTLRTPSRYKI
jgi:hypothetical protein